MRRIMILAAMTVGAALQAPTASAFGTLVPAENVSCAGILAAAANPNAGYLLQNLVKPALDAQGITLGSFERGLAQEHPGAGGIEGLEACIPEFPE